MSTEMDNFDDALRVALERLVAHSEASRAFVVLEAAEEPHVFVQWTGNTDAGLFFDSPNQGVTLVALAEDYIAQARTALQAQFDANPRTRPTPVPLTLTEGGEPTAPQRNPQGRFMPWLS